MAVQLLLLSEFCALILSLQNGVNLGKQGKLVLARRLPLLIKRVHSHPQHWKLLEEPRRGRHWPRNCRSGSSSRFPIGRVQPGGPFVGKSSSQLHGRQFPSRCRKVPLESLKAHTHRHSRYHHGFLGLLPFVLFSASCEGWAPASMLRAEAAPSAFSLCLGATYNVGRPGCPPLPPFSKMRGAIKTH